MLTELIDALIEAMEHGNERAVKAMEHGNERAVKAMEHGNERAVKAMEHGNERAVKKAFSDLRKVGVDATTARIMVAARKDDLKGVRHD